MKFPVTLRRDETDGGFAAVIHGKNNPVLVSVVMVAGAEPAAEATADGTRWGFHVEAFYGDAEGPPA